ncbi:MAG: hypothetical protein HUU10_05460 [Bacteroidetes bacterium]|nr:hypothetical protein [Bacteroidota bacterium]
MKDWPLDTVLNMIDRVDSNRQQYNLPELSSLTADCRDYFLSYPGFSPELSRFLSAFEWHLLFHGEAGRFTSTIRSFAGSRTS